jgi:hypothetical protein
MSGAAIVHVAGLVGVPNGDAAIPASMEVALPVRWHSPGGSRRGLVERMMLWWGERRTVVELFSAVVPVPVLAGFEAAGQRVIGISCVVACVLRGGGVATTDVTALGAAP